MNEILSNLYKILTLSTAAMVLGACIVIGYILRFIRSFPNDGIPVVVVLVGALAMILLAEPRAANMPVRAWVARHIIAGLILGLIAWLSHRLIIKRIEDYVTGQFPAVDRLLNGGSTPPPPPPNTPGP